MDLDGTLAEAEPWRGFEHIGKPVPMMMKRLKIWLDLGYRGQDCHCSRAKPRTCHSSDS